MKLSPGSLVGGRYRIDAYLNEGGMQQVYRATDVNLGRTVALKTPKNDDGERRFDRSAHVSALVSHSNVARTLDYFRDGDKDFLVEELVAGIDLHEVLKRVHRLDAYAAAKILHGLARALAALHALKIVHRDLKPSNIMVVDGFHLRDVKVTDFGVSKMAGAEIDDGVAGGLLLTGSKTLIGHLPYLAPEILRRRKTVDPRADVWAAGALAFHFLAGFPPFGQELADAVTQILTAPLPPLPPAVLGNPQLSGLAQEVYGIAATCLQREPEARPSATQLVSMCERLCYPTEPRETGRVNGYPGGSFGFVDSDSGGTVFFHVDSLVGAARPRVGGRVWFARYRGEPRDRAHPVLPILEEAA